MFQWLVFRLEHFIAEQFVHYFINNNGNETDADYHVHGESGKSSYGKI